MAWFRGYGLAMIMLMTTFSAALVAPTAQAECVGGSDAYVEVCTPETDTTSVNGFTVRPGNGNNCIEPLGNETPGLCVLDKTYIVTTVIGPTVEIYEENLFEDVCLVVNQVAPGTCQTGSSVMGYTDVDDDGLIDGVVFETSEKPIRIPVEENPAMVLP